jgi:hypothetical protein
MIYIVEYTDEACTGNQTLTMEISAENRADAWETVEAHYPHLAVDSVYEKESVYYGA